LPFPLEPAVNEIQEAVFVAVQAQPGGAFTVIEPVPPIAEMEALVGLSEYVQGAGAGAGCDTVTVCPAIVIVPLRAAPVLAAAVNDDVPLPAPLVPEVIVSHGALLVAVHAHVGVVVTVMGADPPPAPIVRLVGLTA
jgi:hypothetical protein